MNDSRLFPAHILLDSWQRAYAHRILYLSDSVPTKDILLTTFRTEDGNAQPEELLEYDLICSTNQRNITYGQHLPKEVLVRLSIHPAEEVVQIRAMAVQLFSGKFCIEEKCKAMKIDIKADKQADLTFRCDRAKLN